METLKESFLEELMIEAEDKGKAMTSKAVGVVRVRHIDRESEVFFGAPHLSRQS
jgi:hypothetical protein